LDTQAEAQVDVVIKVETQKVLQELAEDQAEDGDMLEQVEVQQVQHSTAAVVEDKGMHKMQDMWAEMDIRDILY
jgi:hypothetical protein